MNLLLMANQGLPRNGLVALYDPYRDTYGRNILPVGSENFVTGWSARDGASITITPNQPDPFGGNSAIRIQSTGGTSYDKYAVAVLGLSNPTSFKTAVWGKVLSGGASLSSAWNGTVSTVSFSDSWSQVIVSGNNITSGREDPSIKSVGVNTPLDILVCHPQLNLLTLFPYSPPADLPQSLTDFTGHANNAQLGSTAGADTNDPAYSGQGLTFGTDDYCKSSSPAFDDMQSFTCITVCLAPATGITRSIFNKNFFAGQFTDANKLQIMHYRSTWETVVGANVATAGNNYILGITQKTAGNGADLWINKTKETPIPVGGATGNYASDKDYDLIVGNTASASAPLASTIYLQAWYNRILSDTEYMQAYNYLKRLMSSRGITI